MGDLKHAPFNSKDHSTILALVYLNSMHISISSSSKMMLISLSVFKQEPPSSIQCLFVWDIAGHCSVDCIKQTMQMLKEK